MSIQNMSKEELQSAYYQQRDTLDQKKQIGQPAPTLQGAQQNTERAKEQNVAQGMAAEEKHLKEIQDEWISRGYDPLQDIDLP